MRPNSTSIVAAACLSIAVGAALLSPQQAHAWPTAQTSAITYQGVLKSGGAGMNGNVDLQFKLFDAAAAGSQISSTLISAPVAVTNGLFTVTLDFGALAFNGEERWLEVGVASPAGGGVGPFTTLVPRQKLASAPYAAFALGVNGATVSGINAANIASGTIANARTTGASTNTANSLVLRDASGNFSSNVISAGAFVGSGASLSLLNAGAVSSGTLSDARLSTNVALLSGSQIFTGGKTFSTAPAFTAAGAPFTLTSTTLVTNLNADLLDGLSSAAFLQAIPVPLTLSGANAAAHVIKGENTSTTFDSSGVNGLASGATGIVYGVKGESNSTTGRGVFGTATAATGATVGGKFENSSTAGVGVLGTVSPLTGTTFGAWGESRSTSGRGVLGLVDAATGTTYGGFFESDSTAGRGVLGLAIANTGTCYGVRAENTSTSGRAVFAWATAISGTTYGVSARSDSPAGYAVFADQTATTGVNYAGYFDASSDEGRGVFGIASSTTGVNYGGRFQTPSIDGRAILGYATATTGDNYGVQGWTLSTAGIGLFGLADAATGTTYGVYGESDSTGGYGVYGRNDDNVAVYGHAISTTGSNYGVYGRTDSTSGRGVWGQAAAATGTNYGVYGQSAQTGFGASGYAVYANGNTGASGFKSFRIDHPDDPANKYLLHYAAESPDVINFYSGKVTLNGAGEAVVELPLYFAKINKDPRYTLTAIGASMPNLYVADEIDEGALLAGAKAGPNQAAELCWFRIAGGAPGMKVSWEVKAVRNDLWARTYGAPEVVEKQDRERGTYQHPELYGQPTQMGIDYDPAVVEPVRARVEIAEEPSRHARLEDAELPTARAAQRQDSSPRSPRD